MKRKLIITGSEGLIGREVTNYFHSQDCEVIKADLSLGHDLNNEEFVIKFFRGNKAKYLINLFALNHHISKKDESNNLFDISLDSLKQYLEINVSSLFSVCREFARNNPNGCIVNFSSTYGLNSPKPQIYGEKTQKHIGYGISKAAVIQLTKHLATHLAPDFRVNCIAPGGVRYQQDNRFIEEYSKHTPLKRMMDVSELNGIIDYLCSEKSSYMTGETLCVDGGWSKW